MALLSCSNYAEMSLNSQHRYLELFSFGILTCSLVLDFSSLQTNNIDKWWPAKQLQLYQVCPSSYNMGKVRCLQIIRCQAWRSLRKDITLCIEFTIFHPVWVHPFNLEPCASLPASWDYMSSSGLLVSLQMHKTFWQPYNLELGALLFLLIYHLQRLAELFGLPFCIVHLQSIQAVAKQAYRTACLKHSKGKYTRKSMPMPQTSNCSKDTVTVWF